MIAIANALDFAASNYVGRSILLYSDSPSLVSHISSSYWKFFLFDTQLLLSGESARSLPSRSSVFLVTQVNGKTRWLTNSLIKLYSSPTLLTSTLMSVNRLGSPEASEQPRPHTRFIPGIQGNSPRRLIQPSPEPAHPNLQGIYGPVQTSLLLRLVPTKSSAKTSNLTSLVTGKELSTHQGFTSELPRDMLS